MELYDIIINISDYEFVKKLGNGSYGSVNLYRHKTTKEEYAIKQFFEVTSKKNYMKEIVILFKMRHVAILQIRGFTIPSDSSEPLSIMTDYMSNGSLYDVLNKERRGLAPEGWDMTKKAKVIFRIACALMYVHERGGCHRDIKTANILLDKDFNAYLSDFGLSTLCVENTQSSYKGTPTYMAPELFLEDQKITEKVDIYAFAIVVYEILTLTTPFEKFPNPFQISHFVTKGGRPDLKNIECPDMASFIEQCWDQDPANRPSSRALVNHMMKYNLFPGADEEEFKTEIELLIGSKLPKKPDRSEFFDQSNSAPNSPNSSEKSAFSDSKPMSGSPNVSEKSDSYSDSTYRFVNPKLKQQDSSQNSSSDNNHSYYRNISSTDSSQSSANNSNNHSYYRTLPKASSTNSYSTPQESNSTSSGDNNNHSYYRTLPKSSSTNSYSTPNSDNGSNNHSYYRKLPSLKPESEMEQIINKAKNGDLNSQYQAGLSYLKGFNGFPRDIEKGINYLRLAADRYHSEAVVLLSKVFICNNNYVDAVKYLEIAIRLNNEEALVTYGEMLCTGDHVKLDLARGVSLLQKAMKTVNDVKSLIIIGFRFYKIHTNSLLVDARKCFMKGASLNHPPAIFNYGYMLEKGEGGEIDIKKAIELYVKAADLNSVPAIMHLGELCEEGKYMDAPRLDKALEMYVKAKNLGSVDAIRAIERVEMRRRRSQFPSGLRPGFPGFHPGLDERDLLVGMMLKDFLDF